MENKAKRKIVLRPGTPALKILTVVLILFSLAALVALNWVRGGLEDLTEEKRRQAMALEQENGDLREKNENLGSADSVRDIAREELGMVNPDSVIIGEK